MEQQFLVPSPMYHELRVLLGIDSAGSIRLPLDPRVLPALSLEQLPIARMIEEGVLVVANKDGEPAVCLTEVGRAHMRRLAIDYHLELMGLREVTDRFFEERTDALLAEGCKRVLLYGASDTARVMVAFLGRAAIQVAAVVDDDPGKQGTKLGGVRIVGREQIDTVDFDTIVVTTVAFEDEILRKLSTLGPPQRRLIGLFENHRAAP